MTKTELLELLDKIAMGVASAFDGTPEKQQEALDLLYALTNQADEVLQLLSAAPK